MSEGLWEDPGSLDEWADESIVSEPQPEAWGTPPGTGMNEASSEGEATGPLPVSEAEVVAALEEEGEQETQKDERPRDPATGRFLPKEQEPEPATEAASEPQQEQPLYAGKLKSVEELERAYLELEQRAGQQGRELGELRALRQEMAAIREQLDAPAPTPIPSNWSEVLDDNPAKAAKIALDAGDRERYEEAKEAWELESPGAPEIFEQNLVLNYELSQLRERVEAGAAPEKERSEVAATARALQQVKQDHPDFDQFEEAIGGILQERPLYMDALKAAVQREDAAAQTAIFSDLYKLVADRRSDNLSQAQQEAQAAAAQQQLRARQEAVVVSATGTATETRKSEADRIADDWDKLDAPFRSGWLEP